MQYLTSITNEKIKMAIELGNCDIDVYHETITKDLIDLAHSFGIMVNCWTVNVAQNAKSYINYGVDFITSDILLEVL